MENANEATNANGETQLECVKRRISHILDFFDKDTSYYRRTSEWSQAAIVIIGAIITVLSGLELKFVLLHPVGFSTAILVLGAISTVVAFFGSFLSPQQCWLLNQTSSNKMRALWARIEMDERSPTFSDRADVSLAYFNQYQAIVDEHNKGWLEIRGKTRFIEPRA